MARVVAFHISGRNPESLIPFYRSTLGWEFKKAENPRPTWFITTGAEDKSGIDGMLHTRERDNRVVNTIETEAIDSVVASIEAAGGRLIDRRSIPQAGELALFEDPEGNMFQLRQPPNES
jgi:predicted enzyme related to lactoylglutathione lyase